MYSLSVGIHSSERGPSGSRAQPRHAAKRAATSHHGLPAAAGQESKQRRGRVRVALSMNGTQHRFRQRRAAE
eukprot:1778393-Pleurochrysis_carterae.AAC.2